MIFWLGLAILGLHSLVSSQVIYPKDKGKCLAPNGFCTSARLCSFVPPQFLRDIAVLNQLSICETRDRVCCTSLLTPPVCSRKINRVKVPSRISKGVPSELGDWPWMAALGYKEVVKGAEFKWYCGGSLINHLFVLTAAHCRPNVRGKVVEYLVRLGDLDLKDTTEAAHVERKEKKFIKHTGYNRQKWNDIALVRLDQPVTFTANIQPICLPVSDSLQEKDYHGMKAYVAGWGHTEESQFGGEPSSKLLETVVTVRNSGDCKEGLEGLEDLSASTQLCTISEEGEDSCRGDSGGPLMVSVAGVYYAIGVVSYGNPCGFKYGHGVYTKVTEFIDWIRDNVKVNIQ